MSTGGGDTCMCGRLARHQAGRNEGTTEIEHMYLLACKHVDTRIDV